MLDRKYVARLERFKPYVCARHEFDSAAAGMTFLDANESPYETEFNRYPDPEMRELRAKLAELKNIRESEILVGNGSDEILDLIFRGFGASGFSSVFTLEPTYSMYKTLAELNGLNYVPGNLNVDFLAPGEDFLTKIYNKDGLVVLCRPNNPTGNCVDADFLKKVLETFNGPVVVDEAYIDFCEEKSAVKWINEFDNLFVVQTLSKAYGMAGLRLGYVISNSRNVELINRIKMPYNVNVLSAKQALARLANSREVKEQISQLIEQREWLKEALISLPLVEKVFPSETNFLLIKVKKPRDIISKLIGRGLVIRDRSTLINCEGCVRISVGTPSKNKSLVKALKDIVNEEVINN